MKYFIQISVFISSELVKWINVLYQVLLSNWTFPFPSLQFPSLLQVLFYWTSCSFSFKSLFFWSFSFSSISSLPFPISYRSCPSFSPSSSLTLRLPFFLLFVLFSSLLRGSPSLPLPFLLHRGSSKFKITFFFLSFPFPCYLFDFLMTWNHLTINGIFFLHTRYLTLTALAPMGKWIDLYGRR